MSTARSFNDMLNEYLAYDLLKHETIKRNFVLNRVEIDENWRGGTLPVPFQAGTASSFKYGGLSSTSDVSEHKYVRGSVTGYREIWGTMKFHSRDLMEHGGGGGKEGRVSEQSFLKNLLGTVEGFLDDMKQVVSVNFLNGTHFATLTANATLANGIIVVDRPERFTYGKKVVLKDSNSDITGYVKEIDVNTKEVILYTDRTYATPLDFTGAENLTTAAGAKCYVDGAETASNAFTSLKQQVLSAANGGDATLFGQTKALYPYLQSTQIDGSGFTSVNFLDKLFDSITSHRLLGRGQADEFVMSYGHLGLVMKALESKAGAYRHIKTEANLYGWTTITIVGVKGEFKITGVQEMDDDVIYLCDWKGLKVHTNQGWKKHQDPDGKVYYTVRDTDGFVYYVDLCFYGELVLSKPCHWAVIHSLNVL